MTVATTTDLSNSQRVISWGNLKYALDGQDCTKRKGRTPFEKRVCNCLALHGCSAEEIDAVITRLPELVVIKGNPPTAHIHEKTREIAEQIFHNLR